MAKEYEGLGLEKFLGVVDGIISDLETGRLTGEKVRPKFKAKTMEDTIIKSTEVEIGEDNLESMPIIGKTGKRMVIVTPSDGSNPTVYGSPSVAAREVGLTPTTIKNRCDHEKTDAKGNTWSYQDAE